MPVDLLKPEERPAKQESGSEKSEKMKSLDSICPPDFGINMQEQLSFRGEPPQQGDKEVQLSPSLFKKKPEENARTKFLTEKEILGEEMYIYYTDLVKYYPEREKEISGMQE